MLLLATYLLIMTSAASFYVTAPADDSLSSFTEALWRSWTLVANPGTHADAQGLSQGLSRRVIALLTSIGGMMLFALVLSMSFCGWGFKKFQPSSSVAAAPLEIELLSSSRLRSHCRSVYTRKRRFQGNG